MKERPKIELKQSKKELIFEILSWVTLVLLWGFAVFAYYHTLDTIASHSVLGQSNNINYSAMVFVFPVLGLLLYLGLTIICRYPNKFNYPTAITEDNAKSKYEIATTMIRYLKLIILLFFFLFNFFMYYDTDYSFAYIEKWLVVLFLLMVFIPLFYFVNKLMKKE